MLLLGNVVLLVGSILIYSSFVLQTVDAWLQDYQFKKTATHQPDERIVIVAIDNNSIEQLGQFPWDRSIYAPLLDNINTPSHEPEAITFDILFSEPSNEESDKIFAQTLAQYDKIIFPVVGETVGQVFSTTGIDPEKPFQVNSLIKPYTPFAELTHHAHINRVTSNDGVIRHMWLKVQTPDGELIPNLAYKALSLAGIDLSAYEDRTDLKKTKDELSKHTLTIDYNVSTDDFITVSFIDVINGHIPPTIFEDAFVFVGFTATGLGDDGGIDAGKTPLERNAKLVYVHANIANQLLNGTQVTYIPFTIELSILILLFILFSYIPWRFKTIYTFIAYIVTVASLFGIQHILFKFWDVYFYISAIVVAILLTYIFNLSLKAYREQQQKSFVTRQFARYISPDLVKQIVNKGLDLELGGVSKNVTVLFLDIRGFTSLSEKLKPVEVVDILNTIFTMITNTVLKFNGSIDKFIGDAAMILFNAPLDVENHEKQAVVTAFHIQQNMIPIQAKIKNKYGVEVAIGIGIHTGPVVIGNIGSYLRMDYTAIGDTVNTASRIESGTKAGQMLVSEQIYEKTKHFVEYSEPEEKVYKGKSAPMKIYEIINVKEG